MGLLIEIKLLATNAIDYYAVAIGCSSIDYGAANTPLECAFVHRSPSALGVITSRDDFPRVVGLYEYEVGIVTRTDESATVDMEKCGRIMTHELGNPFDWHHSLVNHLEHGDE